MTFNPVTNTAVTIEVETATPSTYVQVLGLTRIGRRSGRSARKTSIFMIASQISSTGPLAETVTASGIVDPADPGLLRILAQKAANANIKLKVTYDGTNGWTQVFRVESLDTDADPDTDYTMSITMDARADAVAVGTGPIF